MFFSNAITGIVKHLELEQEMLMTINVHCKIRVWKYYGNNFGILKQQKIK